jgi:hypothetical protein
MSVSCLTCSLDRDETEMGTYKWDIVNGVSGTYRLRYKVQMASPCSPVSIMLNAHGASPDSLPTLWQTYAYQGDVDATSYAKQFDITRSPQSASYYYVAVTYSPAEPGEMPETGTTPIGGTTNPINRRPVFWTDREVTTRNEKTDQTGYVVKTSSNTLYEDLVEHERARAITVAEFNVATLNETINYSRVYDQAVNATAWTFRGTSYPPRTAMVREVSASPKRQEGSYTYYRVSMRIAFSDSGTTFDVPLPEMSTAHYSKTGGTYDTDSNGFRKLTFLAAPVMLNVDGTRRSDDQPALVTNWRVRREVDFNSLTILNT